MLCLSSVVSDGDAKLCSQLLVSCHHATVPVLTGGPVSLKENIVLYYNQVPPRYLVVGMSDSHSQLCSHGQLALQALSEGHKHQLVVLDPVILL